jgi:hypothetical protein
MLGIISAAGNALRAFGTVHPAIKWGVVILAGLLAVELIGKEAISVYVAMRTAGPQIEQVNAQARQTAAQAKAATARPFDTWKPSAPLVTPDAQTQSGRPLETQRPISGPDPYRN